MQERWHEETPYLPAAVSMSALYRTICDRLKKGPHKGCKKPSVKLLQLQFQPKDSHIASAARYTGRFNIQYAVQKRQLHGNHEDGHHTCAQFR